MPLILSIILVYKSNVVLVVLDVVHQEDKAIQTVVRVLKEVIQLETTEESINEVVFVSGSEWLFKFVVPIITTLLAHHRGRSLFWFGLIRVGLEHVHSSQLFFLYFLGQVNLLEMLLVLIT